MTRPGITMHNKYTSLRKLLTVGGAYLLVAWLCIVTTQSHSVANLWFPNGIGLMALSVAGAAYAPTLLTLGLANLLANLLAGNTWGLSALFVAPNLLEMVAGAWLLNRFVDVAAFVTAPAQLGRLIFWVCLLPSAASAVLGAAILSVYGADAPLAILVNWFTGDLIGLLAGLPVLLVGRSARADAAAPGTAPPAGGWPWADLLDKRFLLGLVALPLSGYLLITLFEFPSSGSSAPRCCARSRFPMRRPRCCCCCWCFR